jgi:hypothetical protein
VFYFISGANGIPADQINRGRHDFNENVQGKKNLRD